MKGEDEFASCFLERITGSGSDSEVADPITLVILRQVKCLQEYCATNWGDQGQRDFVRNTTYLLKNGQRKRA